MILSKETFKNFVRKHPELSNNVLNNKTSWQKLYEIYELYGEDSSVWNDYVDINERNFQVTNQKDVSFSDLINMVKRIDLDSVQRGVSNLQKTIGLLQDIGIGSKNEQPTYEPRPLYKYFDD